MQCRKWVSEQNNRADGNSIPYYFPLSRYNVVDDVLMRVSSYVSIKFVKTLNYQYNCVLTDPKKWNACSHVLNGYIVEEQEHMLWVMKIGEFLIPLVFTFYIGFSQYRPKSTISTYYINQNRSRLWVKMSRTEQNSSLLTSKWCSKKNICLCSFYRLTPSSHEISTSIEHLVWCETLKCSVLESGSSPYPYGPILGGSSTSGDPLL